MTLFRRKFIGEIFLRRKTVAKKSGPYRPVRTFTHTHIYTAFKSMHGPFYISYFERSLRTWWRQKLYCKLSKEILVTILIAMDHFVSSFKVVFGYIYILCLFKTLQLIKQWPVVNCHDIETKIKIFARTTTYGCSIGSKPMCVREMGNNPIGIGFLIRHPTQTRTTFKIQSKPIQLQVKLDWFFQPIQNWANLDRK